MNFVKNSRAGRVYLRSLAVLSLLLAIAWIGKTYVAHLVARSPSVADYKLAIKLDPNNAEYHLLLGRLYEYSPTNEDSRLAIAEFRRAAELSPYDPQPWINLAAAAGFEGDVAGAERFLQVADRLAPHLPSYQWPIANFYLLHGNNEQAFLHFKVVLAATRKYDSLIFSTAWKASGDANDILHGLIPEDLPAEFSYLSFLMGRHRYAECRPLWGRIIAGKSNFPAEKASDYIDGLIRAQEPEGAYQAWTELERKGIVRYATPDPPGNLVTNGDFEDRMLNMGFDWQVSPTDGVFAGLDTSNYRSPNHALLVEFSGRQNLHYRDVFQYIPVQPSTAYRLRAFMKTKGITSDSGPRLEIRDAYDPNALDELTPSMTGDSLGWTPILLDFKTGRKTVLLILSLTRLPGHKFDNSIAGKVWLDDVQLTALGR